MRTTRALNEAIDRQVSTVIAALQILTETEDFDLERDKLHILHKRLKRSIENQKDWIGLSYSDLEGNQFFNTSRPFGEKLPSFASESFFQEVLREKQVVVSGFREGLVTKAKVISIGIPVFRKKVLKYVLIASIDINAFSRTLYQQSLPSSWIAAILDQDGKIIGRSRSPEDYIGTSGTQKLKSLIGKHTKKIFQDINLEGERSYGAFYSSNLTGWSVVIGVPYTQFNSRTWQTLWMLLIAGAVFIGLGILLAYLLGRKISRPILELANHARAIGTSYEVPKIETNLLEVIEVSNALEVSALKRKMSDQMSHEAITLRDTFLSVASHELKTPITALQLNLQMVKRRLLEEEVGEKSVESLSKALYQVSRLTLLVNELLDVSTITSGKMQFHFEEVNLSDLVNEIANRFSGSPISINCTEKVLGEWDKGRLEQVITNLISNAIKYGQGKPIEISIEKNDHDALIKVRDFGLGIDKKDQERIFQKFERAIESSSISGLGLGLWISDQIIKEMKGSITLESELNQGATFFVTIPLKKD